MSCQSHDINHFDLCKLYTAMYDMPIHYCTNKHYYEFSRCWV